VVSVDRAAAVIDAARDNARRNGLDARDPRWRFVVDDAFAFLARDRGAYGIVIADPPSMAPSAASVPRARHAYRRLNASALARVAEGGLLVTASCSSHMPEADFKGVVLEAAAASRRRVRVVRTLGAGPDHPVRPWFPEGNYLTVLVLRVQSEGARSQTAPDSGIRSGSARPDVPGASPASSPANRRPKAPRRRSWTTYRKYSKP
jgi:23S rRNA (cytosine1962-C5)-methyltransferase